MASIDLGSEQIPTTFGGEFVAEKHSDAAAQRLPIDKEPATGIACLWMVFYLAIGLVAVAQWIVRLF